jgi:hypothetical protein
LLVICGELCGGFVVGKICQFFEINLWKIRGLPCEKSMTLAGFLGV